MSTALPNPTGPIITLDSAAISTGLAASRINPRKRIILPLQRSQSARVQRLANFLQPGTYIQPHCHPEPHATESVTLIHGRLEILHFSESGQILARWTLEENGTRVIDIEPRTWHGMIVHQKDTIIFEVKQGPYDPTRDKTFAPWAPAESDPQAPAYLKSLTADGSESC